MENITMMIWMPMGILIFTMFIWGLLIWIIARNKAAKAFINKHSILGWGWFLMAATMAVFLVFKSITSPLVRPVAEVAPKAQQPLVVESIPPLKLENLTLQAKPKDVIDKQPLTPLVDKAIEDIK